jgi:hypothetical protein
MKGHGVSWLYSERIFRIYVSCEQIQSRIFYWVLLFVREQNGRI